MALPNILLQEIQERKCLLFIGAGLSINANLPQGMTMPTWSQLASLLAKELKQLSAQPSIEIENNDPLEIISLYERLLGRNILITKMAELLHIQHAKPGPVHKQLSKINEFDTIVTTNFDHILERSYGIEEVNVIVGDKNISKYSPHTHTNIIKIHGDFSNYPTMVITKNDYKLFHNNHPVLATNVAAWFSTKIPLFIGYSLNDPHFIQIKDFLKEALGDFLNRWFIVQFDATQREITKAQNDDMLVINLRTEGETKERVLLKFLREIQDYVTTKHMNTLASTEEELQRQPQQIKEISKDNLTGRIVNAFLNLETNLRTKLKKFGHIGEYQEHHSFSLVVKSALSLGILTMPDIGRISRIREIRNRVVHISFQVTRQDAEYVEKSVAHIIQKLSKIEATATSPIRIELSTNKDFFRDNDTLIINGKVTKVANFPVTIQIAEVNSNLVSV